MSPARPRLLFVCTANRCRSPIAHAMAVDWFGRAGIEASVDSAGLIDGGMPVSDGSEVALTTRGLDLARRVSRQVTADALDRADLVLAMERTHVRELVDLAPDAYGRTFTLLELARRGSEQGARERGQSLAEWLAYLHAARMPADHLGTSEDDDIHDPFGQRQSHYEACADRIADAVDVALRHAFGASAAPDIDAETHPGGG